MERPCTQDRRKKRAGSVFRSRRQTVNPGNGGKAVATLVVLAMAWLMGMVGFSGCGAPAKDRSEREVALVRVHDPWKYAGPDVDQFGEESMDFRS